MRAQGHRLRLLVAVISGGSVLILLIAIGVFGLLRGPTPPREAMNLTASATTAPTVAAIARPVALASSSDPSVFAQVVARALFRWDTRGAALPSDWAQIVIDRGDDEEAAGLASDVRNYLPSMEHWNQLRTYGARQWLTISSVEMPSAWASAVAQAAPGQLPPGATAYTISGTRHRTGMWAERPTTTQAPVAFTVFLACPNDDECRILRLSRLDEPLD